MIAAAAKQRVQDLLEPTFETVTQEAVLPIWDEMRYQTSLLIDKNRKRPSPRPRSLGHDDLENARKAHNIEEMDHADHKESESKIEKIKMVLEQYKEHEHSTKSEQHHIKREVTELQEQLAEVAKETGSNTAVHLENVTNQASEADIQRLSGIIKDLREKAAEAKDNNISQAKNAKPTTGMLAWVSGKQMKIHEQGTMTLQG